MPKWIKTLGLVALAVPLLAAYVVMAGIVLGVGSIAMMDLLEWWQTQSGAWRVYWLGAAFTGSGMILPGVRGLKSWLRDQVDWISRILVIVYVVPIGLAAWTLVACAWPLVAWAYLHGRYLRYRGRDFRSIQEEREDRALLEQLQSEGGEDFDAAQA